MPLPTAAALPRTRSRGIRLLEATSLLCPTKPGPLHGARAPPGQKVDVRCKLELIAVKVVLHGFKPLRRWRLRHIPGPRPTWYLGDIPRLQRMGAACAHEESARKYGPIFTSFSSSRPFIIVEEPAAARALLLQNPARPRFQSIWTGREAEFEAANILAVKGDKHRSLRGAWQPFFFTGSLEAYAQLMNDATGIVLDVLARAAKAGGPVDLHAVIGSMTLQVVGTSAFGTDFYAEKGDAGVAEMAEDAVRLKEAISYIFKAGGRFSTYILLAVFFPFLTPLWRRLARILPDPGFARMRAARQTIITACTSLIREHRKEIAEEGSTQGKGEGNGEKDRHCNGKDMSLNLSFLDLLMRATDRTTGRGFKDLEVANQAFVMLLAGYETTANAIVFALYLLSTAKDKEARLVAEVDAFGRDRTLTYADLESFPYVEAALKESLRLYPPAPLILREATSDTALCGKPIRKGDWIAVAAYSMHRNPKYWQDPQLFLPERFLEGTPEAAARPLHGWVPFGEGTRACIGSRFAMEEAKIALIRLYLKFTFDLEPGQVPLKIRNTITMSPKEGVHAKVKPRNT